MLEELLIMEAKIMINEETRRKLRELNLSELITGLEVQQKEYNIAELTFDERFQRLTDYLYQEKYNSKIKRMIKAAKFRLANAEIRDIVYGGRNIDKNTINELTTCQFIDNNTDIIIQGFTGAGKTYLSNAIGKQACRLCIQTKYIRLPDLLQEMEEQKSRKMPISKLLKKYGKCKLLILDEWLLDSLNSNEQSFIFELMERRHDTSSTIFCSQFRLEDWHSKLGGGAMADAIMDRIVHNAIKIETGSMNMREYNSKSRTRAI